MTIQEKLENCQTRIRVIRETLADTSYLSDITIDGVSEKIDRKALREELKELEEEEAKLQNALNGVNSKLFGIQMRR